MKKVLFASTALVMMAGSAYADVKISGYGRFGLNYYDYDGNDANTTQFFGRLRLNFDASMTTDGGVEFGGRIRMQWDQGSSSRGTAAALNAALMYVSYGGFRVEVGNANTAFDSAALLYAPEVGVQSRSYGDPQGAFFAYNTGPYSTVNRVGIFASYSVGQFTGRISWVTIDQTGITDTDDEYGISADYTFGNFTISGAAVQNGAGINDNDQYFVGVAYKANALNVGLNYIDNGKIADVDQGNLITGYGFYTFGNTTVGAYIANNDADGLDNDTVYGVGASYDLGGATLAGAIESGYADGEVRGDLGVKFNF